MSKYIVVKDFTDLEDGNYVYTEGDKFPRKGKCKKARIEELLSTTNKRGEILIKEIEEGD
ncbi:hypothetical protein MKX78_19600 [Cytobacillus sp. FSL R5-0569]|uniref:hypothetical protein n=1 Tax=Cytobacillus sp. FSL R5-0569 TaxID=2921649 RepID=UPI0030FBFC3B